MDADGIEIGLAAHGVPTFAHRPPATEAPPPLDELIVACLTSGKPRYKAAVISLVLVTEPERARGAVGLARQRLDAAGGRWLRWLVLAAHYLARVYRRELASLLGRPPFPPVDLFNASGLPDDEADHGEAGIRALAAEIAKEHGAVIDWAGTLEDPVRDLMNVLWLERRARGRAESRKATHH